MILFWVLCAGLVLLALLFVVPSLLRSKTVVADAADLNITLAEERLAELEQEAERGNLAVEQLDAARDEVRQDLLTDVESSPADQALVSERRLDFRGLVVVLAAVPLLAVSLYFAIGDRNAVLGVPTQASVQQDDQPSIEQMVARLEARLAQQGDDVNGWLMLGRSYLYMQRPADAAAAFDKAYALAPENPDVMIEYAASLAGAANGNMQGRPEELIRAALERQPHHPNGLFLLGHAHFQRGDNLEAAKLWQQVLAMLPPESEDAAQIGEYIAEAQQRAGLSPAMAAAPSPQPAAAGKKISVSVSLSPTLADAVAPGDTLFVYARAVSGPRMPLAIVRTNASELPLQVVLDESMAMMPEMTLAAFDQVTVEARISKTGSAIPQSGDIRGTFTPATPGSGEVIEILIDSKVP